MTSSLVGSEMCIRDSPMGHGVSEGATISSAHPPPKAVAPKPENVTLESVSYTHLTLPTICSV
eukprot:4612248-Prorocentrum_lima.AAC.1